MFQNVMSSICGNAPQAMAEISGGTDYPDIHGVVLFYEAPYSGVVIEAKIYDLPVETRETPAFFGFHIHENGDCSDNFANTGGHYNPEDHPHPSHAGDLPPLLSGNGYSWLSFYDSCLSITQVLGKSVIIHGNVDDFTTQPAGNAGEKIACGVVKGSVDTPLCRPE